MRVRGVTGPSTSSVDGELDDDDPRAEARRAEAKRVTSRVIAMSALLAGSFFAWLSCSLLYDDPVADGARDASPPPHQYRRPLETFSISGQHQPGCIVDELVAQEGSAADSVADGREWQMAHDGERYLIYSPQFGLGNQQITLRNAVIWALLLNRTLVLPHLLGHSGCSNETLCSSSSQEMASHAVAFTVGGAAGATAVAPLRTLEMSRFLELRLRPRRLLVLAVRALWAYRMTDAYWGLLGLTWHQAAPPLDVPLSGFSPAEIRAAFGSCRHHAVLGFRSLFAAADMNGPDGKSTPEWPKPGQRWADTTAMPALYRPASSLRAAADRLVRALRTAAEGGSSGGAAPEGGAALACVHIRRGDIIEDCERYAEEAKLRTGRSWVKSHFRNGYSCHQPAAQLALNLEALVRRVAKQRPARGLALYAAVEDAATLRSPLLAPFNISSLSSLMARPDLGPAVAAALPASLPAGLRDVLLDQLVCARAEHLVLNIFSTFSQMMQTRIGLDHPDVVGWTRDLSKRHQAKLKVDVEYWTDTRGLKE